MAGVAPVVELPPFVHDQIRGQIGGGSEWPTLTIHGAITDAQWEQMLEVLRSVKPALVEPE